MSRNTTCWSADLQILTLQFPPPISFPNLTKISTSHTVLFTKIQHLARAQILFSKTYPKESTSCHISFSFVALQPNWAYASTLSRFLHHTPTHYTRYDSSGLVIGPSQRPLPNNTHGHPCPQRDSNSYSNKRAAADPRLRPRDHWDRLAIALPSYSSALFCLSLQ
jgi:hypothetical protein